VLKSALEDSRLFTAASLTGRPGEVVP